jgi:hypothetical protein
MHASVFVEFTKESFLRLCGDQDEQVVLNCALDSPGRGERSMSALIPSRRTRYELLIPNGSPEICSERVLAPCASTWEEDNTN